MIAVLWTYEAWYFVTFRRRRDQGPAAQRPARADGRPVSSHHDLSCRQRGVLLCPDARRDARRDADRRARRHGAGRAPAGATFVALTVVVSTFGNNVAGDARGLSAAIRDGVRRRIFSGLPAVHPRYRTPHFAIVGSDRVVGDPRPLGILRTALHLRHVRVDSLQPGDGGRNVQAAARSAGPSPSVSNAGAIPVVPLIFIAGSAAFVINTLLERPVQSLIGLGLLSLGFRPTGIGGSSSIECGFAILGSGAVGGYYGAQARARRSRRDVHRARSRTSHAIRDRGLEIRSPMLGRLHGQGTSRGRHREGRGRSISSCSPSKPTTIRRRFPRQADARTVFHGADAAERRRQRFGARGRRSASRRSLGGPPTSRPRSRRRA